VAVLAQHFWDLLKLLKKSLRALVDVSDLPATPGATRISNLRRVQRSPR